MPERPPLATQIGRASPDQLLDGPESVGGQDRRSQRDVSRIARRGQRLQALNKMRCRHRATLAHGCDTPLRAH